MSTNESAPAGVPADRPIEWRPERTDVAEGDCVSMYACATRAAGFFCPPGRARVVIRRRPPASPRRSRCGVGATPSPSPTRDRRLEFQVE